MPVQAQGSGPPRAASTSRSRPAADGDFSAVSAASKDETILLLDEAGNAEVCELFSVKNFMVHFHLKKEADDLDEFIPVELEGFGEETDELLCERVYPIYSKASMEADKDWPDDDSNVPQEKQEAAWKKVNDALATQRGHQWGAKEPLVSNDPDAARIQQSGHDVPSNGRKHCQGTSPSPNC